MAKKHLGWAIIGEIVLKAVNDYFIDDKKKYEHIDWFVKFATLFIKTKSQWLKIVLHRENTKVLELINKRLDSAGYEQKIDKIFFRWTSSPSWDHY